MRQGPHSFALLAIAVLAIAPAAQASPGGSWDGAPAGDAVASGARCPGQARLRAPLSTQLRAMRCMVNVARRRAGLRPLAADEQLNRSAKRKTADILRCDSFSHFACGREFSYWIRRTGYASGDCWRAAENLAWGTGRYGTVRSIFQNWMRSPGHRANILGDYDDLGVSLRGGVLQGHRGARVWTQHIGSHCGSSP
jgi:uncharacterized protein YkwD